MKRLRRIILGVLVTVALGSTAAQDVLFTNIARLTNRETALKFVAPAGLNYRIDASTNLSFTNPVRWNSWLTLQSIGVNQHTDSATPYLNSRFYRAEQLTNSFVLTGDNLPTTNGDVVIHPLGHATFVMSWNGLMIYNDPTNGAAPYSSFPRADLVLVSHDHNDHYSSNTLSVIRGTNGVIIAPPAVYNLTSFAPFRSNAIALAYGRSTNVMGITVEAVAAYNGNHPSNANNAYVITLGSKRIFTSGDCGDNAEIRGVTNVDVAFLCMNLPFTMNAVSATNVIRTMRPRVVYPYHYKETSGGNSFYTNALYFKQLLGTDPGIEVRLRKWY